MNLRVKILLSLTLILIMVLAVLWNQYQNFMTTPLQVSEDGYVYNVETGSNLRRISQDLHNAGVSELPMLYLPIYGRIEGTAHLIKTGEYLIKPDTTLPQLLKQLIGGQVVQYPFTIVEGMTAQQLINMIASDERFTKIITDISLSSVMIAIGQPDNHGEGEFSPETYYFAAGTTDKDMLIRAHKLMTLNLEQAWENKADKLPYKIPYEALIMASIIEKETGIAEERAQISGVFVRRLNKGMRLQTDPTVIYGMGEQYDGNIRRKDLKKDTPYNTYTRYGLPPTPIALPSKESIEAALHPAEGKSLYFVATGKDGRHVFSNTLQAHNKAVRQYQLKK
ncbi:MAG: endolytic transglycosylase MltG [Gammaproteobacteria bacterium]|nr:MAG: endolytic transglycosylase MltG [Gammaproteobacteria bacterium]